VIRVREPTRFATEVFVFRSQWFDADVNPTNTVMYCTIVLISTHVKRGPPRTRRDDVAT
jgi:hypothetical protein